MTKAKLRNKTRLIVPDSHGAHVDSDAAAAMLRDVRGMRVDEVVWLGDHLDCGGLFSTHQRSYTREMAESFEDDCAGANWLLDEVQKAAPSAQQHYIEGNHEAHVERWASRTFHNKQDADRYLERQGPAAVLELKRRGIRYYKQSELHGSCSVPGMIRLGKVFFSHGWAFSKHATYAHLSGAGESIVHGHTHRAQSILSRTATSDAIGGHCPGTLAKLQPLYRHNSPSEWTHGYALQLVSHTGRFLHIHVPIVRGSSMLASVQALGARRR